MQYRAVIPEGVKPGTVVSVRASGVVVNVRIPKGNPGDSFLFEVPHQTIKEAQANAAAAAQASRAAAEKKNTNNNTTSTAASASASSTGDAISSSTATGGGTGGANDDEEPITASSVVAAGTTNSIAAPGNAMKRKSLSSSQQQSSSSLSKTTTAHNNNKNFFNQLFVQVLDYLCSNVCCCCFWNIHDTFTQLSDFSMAVLFGVCIGLSILMGFVLGILSVTGASSSSLNSSNNNNNVINISPTMTLHGVQLHNIEVRTSPTGQTTLTPTTASSSQTSAAAAAIAMDGTTAQVIVDTSSMTENGSGAGGQFVVVKGDLVKAASERSKVTTTINAEGKTVIRIQGVPT